MRIIGEEDWEWKDAEAKVQTGGQFSVTGEFTDNLQFADREKEKSFIDSITSGMLHNQAATGVESAMSVIMGRTAAYSGPEVTWDEMIASNLSYEGEILPLAERLSCRSVPDVLCRRQANAGAIETPRDS